MNRSILGQVLAALAGMAIAITILYYGVTTDLAANYGYAWRYRLVGGALFTVGGLSIWLIAKLLRELVSNRGGVSYIVLCEGVETSYENRRLADMSIANYVSRGSSLGAISLRRVVTRIDSKGSVTINSEDIPIDR